MTTRQENRNNMYRSVINCVRANEAVAGTIPNFMTSFNLLTNYVTQIHSFGEIQRLDRSGITLEKKKVKRQLILTAVDFSGMILAYARSTGNDKLLKEAKFSESDLENVSDVALLDLVRIVRSKAAENGEALKEYGITAEYLKELDDTIVKFDALIQAPRTGISQKSMATKTISSLFIKADEALENMDFAVNGVRRRQPGFYDAYRSARIVVDLGTGKLALTAKVRSNDGTPLSGVAFRLKPEKSSDGVLLKKTAKTGGLNIKTLPAGNYNVVVSKPGFVDKEITISVSEKERTEVVIELDKV